MKKAISAGMLSILLILLCACEGAAMQISAISVVYAVTAVISLAVFVGYCFIRGKKEKWFLLLFFCVFLVNLGYFLISVSKTLGFALMANRLAYFGSVFLPPAMLFNIYKVTKTRYNKWLVYALMSVAVIVFLIAASPGILDIYYKEVTLVIKGGASALSKVYGPLHIICLIYLLGYFIATAGAVIYAYVKKRLASTSHAILLALSVFVNIGVWFAEQMVELEFEFLAVSYIISEFFLFGLHFITSENERLRAQIEQRDRQDAKDAGTEQVSAQTIENFLRGKELLTPTERIIFDAYVAKKSTKQIMAELCITENTLKFHNKNIYGKLCVKSRRELIEIQSAIDAQENK